MKQLILLVIFLFASNTIISQNNCIYISFKNDSKQSYVENYNGKENKIFYKTKKIKKKSEVYYVLGNEYFKKLSSKKMTKKEVKQIEIKNINYLMKSKEKFQRFPMQQENNDIYFVEKEGDDYTITKVKWTDSTLINLK